MISRYPSSGEAVLTSPATTPAPLHGTVNPPTPRRTLFVKSNKRTSDDVVSRTSSSLLLWSLETQQRFCVYLSHNKMITIVSVHKQFE